VPAYLKPANGENCQSFLSRVGRKPKAFSWDDRPENCLPVVLSVLLRHNPSGAQIGFRQTEFNRINLDGITFVVPVEELFSACPELALLLHDATESDLRKSGELARKAQGPHILNVLETLTQRLIALDAKFASLLPAGQTDQGLQPSLSLLIPVADLRTLTSLHAGLTQIHLDATTQLPDLGLRLVTGEADFHGSLVTAIRFASPFYSAGVRVSIERFAELYSRLNKRLDLLASKSRVNPCCHQRYW
jgi:hypothetical protein